MSLLLLPFIMGIDDFEIDTKTPQARVFRIVKDFDGCHAAAGKADD